MQLMLQATVCDCLALDPFAFEEDGLGSSEVDVGRREIAQALVIAAMVVMSHEGRDQPAVGVGLPKLIADHGQACRNPS